MSGRVIVPTARAIVLGEPGVLLMERRSRRGHYYSIPGGKIERGEKPPDTIERELKAETGIDLRVVCPLGAAAHRLSERRWRYHHFMLCLHLAGVASLQPDCAEASKTHELYRPGWFNHSAFLDISSQLHPGHQIMSDIIALLLSGRSDPAFSADFAAGLAAARSRGLELKHPKRVTKAVCSVEL